MVWNDKCDYCEPAEVKYINPTGNNLTIIQLNIRSLLGKQDDLINMINSLNKNKSLPKVLLLSETHLNDSKTRHINIPNYNISYRNRIIKPGGGVAILTHKTLTYKNRIDLYDLNKDNFECVFIELNQKAKKLIIIGSIYCPPNTKPREFINQYQHMLTRLKLEKKRFNIRHGPQP